MRWPTPPAEVTVDARTARQLLIGQHPDLADRPLRRIGTGWDNVVFRLGADLVVRIPRRELGARLISSELRWLPGLASRLPLPVPVPVRAGQPTDEYPWPWSICRYVRGRPLGADRLDGACGRAAAESLAGFLAALHEVAPPDAPRNPFRGVALAERSSSLLAGLAAVPEDLRTRVRDEWEAAVAQPRHVGADRWLHGDLHGLNVVAARGRITGVIDFGDLCAGDPATDLACAWLLLEAPARAHMRAHVAVGDAQWARGRGWALFLSVMFLAHSRDSAELEAIGLRGLRAVLDEEPT